MEVVEFSDPGEYRSFLEPLLLADEARNNLILGITGILIEQPDTYEQFRLWAVEGEEGPLAAATRTPPYNIILSDVRADEALPPLVNHISVRDDEIPGVIGIEPFATDFSQMWSHIRGVETNRLMSQGIYALDEVAPGLDAKGNSRRAGDDDFELVVLWLKAFFQEASPGPDAAKVEVRVRNRLQSSERRAGIWLWEHEGHPVSVSSYGGPTPSGMRISWVYTPPEHRRNGYATALVAQQSRWLLDQGWQWCFLYTDMSNPVANSIYQKIGYRKVPDSTVYEFSS